MKRKLTNVTLLGVDHKLERSKKAFDICEYYFDFADTKLINADINSKEEYSHFMIKELNKYVQTDYVLVIQYDGFILNPDAWTDEFLQYDYVGAPWRYNDGNNVGNGGFSLRSKKLLDILAHDPHIVETHPEDDCICRVYGDYLRSKGIKFAPEEVAKKFSIEGSLEVPSLPVKFGSTWTDEFGFHGLQKTDISHRKDRDRFFDKKYDIKDYLKQK